MTKLLGAEPHLQFLTEVAARLVKLPFSQFPGDAEAAGLRTAPGGSGSQRPARRWGGSACLTCRGDWRKSL